MLTFLVRRSTDNSVERPLRCKDLYSPVGACRSTCLSNLWLAHAPTLCHGITSWPRPYSNPINTRAHRARGFRAALVTTGSATPLTRSRDLRLSSPSHPSSLGSVQIPRRSVQINKSFSSYSYRRARATVVALILDS